METQIFQIKGFPAQGLFCGQCVRKVDPTVNLLVDSTVKLLIESGEPPKKTTQEALSILLQMATPACQRDSLSHKSKRAFGEASLV